MQGLGILFLFNFITLQAIIKPQYVDQIPKAVKVSSSIMGFATAVCVRVQKRVFASSCSRLLF